MKKFNLFKVIGISVLVTLILTWFISSVNMSTGEKGINPVGIFDFFNYLISSFSYFGTIGIFILVVGGFYGVLNKTGAYDKLIHDIAVKFRKNEKIFIILTILLLALITSLSGLTIQIFVIIPLLISLILYMGYDKLVAISSTFGAILVGSMGSTYNNYITGPIVQTLALETSEVLLTNVIVLIVVIVLLTLFVLKHIKSDNKSKKYLDNLTKEDPLLMGGKSNKKSYLGIIIVLSLILIVSILGVTSWTTINPKLTVFDTVTNWLFELKIGEFTIVSKIIGSLKSFGNWWLNEITVTLIIATLIIKLVYRIKFNELLESFFDGCKKLIPTVGLIMLLYTVLIISTYHPFLTTVTEWGLGLTNNFNAIIVSLLAMVSSLFNVELMYVTQSTLATVKTTITDTSIYPLIATIFQSIYCLVMLIAPTSVILVLGLGYLNVDYTTWIKYIWKFIIQLLIFLLATFIILLIML